MIRKNNNLIAFLLTVSMIFTFSVPVFAGKEEAVLSAASVKLRAAADRLGSLSAGSDYVDGEGVFIADTKEEAEETASQYNATLKSYNHRIAVIQFNESTVDALNEAFTSNSVKVPVEPNYIFHSCDEEAYSYQYGIDTVSTNDPYALSSNEFYQYFHDKIHSLKAHGITTGKGAKIAVLDSGCTPDHEDSVLDSDHALHVSSVSSATDTTVGHGIHCVGIINEKKNNGLGGFGVAPDAELYSIKMSDSKDFELDSVLEGFSIAMEKEVNVISISLAGQGVIDSLQNICDEAYNKGITIVAASGNYGTNSEYVPAAYDSVISVASTDKDDKLAHNSNYGEWVDIAAPGVLITSTYLYGHGFTGTSPQNTYGRISGTSMATPMVAAAAALCYSVNKSFLEEKNSDVPDAVRDILLSTTDGKTYTYGDHSVKGLVQADKAVLAAKDYVFNEKKEEKADPGKQGSISYNSTVQKDLGNINGYQVSVNYITNIPYDGRYKVESYGSGRKIKKESSTKDPCIGISVYVDGELLPADMLSFKIKNNKNVYNKHNGSTVSGGTIEIKPDKKSEYGKEFSKAMKDYFKSNPDTLTFYILPDSFDETDTDFTGAVTGSRVDGSTVKKVGKIYKNYKYAGKNKKKTLKWDKKGSNLLKDFTASVSSNGQLLLKAQGNYEGEVCISLN